MNYKEKYQSWLESPFIDEKTKEELLAIQDNEEEIKDRFHQDLEFGTAGLRGIIAAGSNRMNQYTVGLATEALARTIEDEGAEAKKRGVAIAYDVRHKSKEFAQITAGVLAKHGIKVYIHKEIQPTPILSYTIRHLKTISGVMMTASHNPKEYNGYKAYWEEGSQILDDIADRIVTHIENIQNFGEIAVMNFEEGIQKGIIEYVPEEVLTSYMSKVENLSLHKNIDYDTCIVYSPLNGTGNKPVREILRRKGFTNINVVKEQENPDPDFMTVGYPNPEDPKAFHYSELLGEKINADILLATDPDCDRCALEVKNENGEYVFFNGNKIGALLIHYILSSRAEKNQLSKDHVIVKSIVTGDLGKSIAKSFGVETKETLTGFKNICGLANRYDETKEYQFLFGYEESIGYVYQNFVRDKDAVNSSLMISEMAAYYKQQGKSLLDVLNELYEKYGFYQEKVNSYVLEGISGKERIDRMMVDFRNNPITQIGDMKLAEVRDYKDGFEDIGSSNVLKYFFDDGSWYAIRPSGTEPKIKIYMSVKGKDDENSQDKLTMIEKITEAKMNLVK